MLPATATGADLVEAVRREAARRNVAVIDLAAKLSPHPGTWLKQVAIAKRPKPHTIARVNALLAGQAVPDAPPNNFQAAPTHDRLINRVMGAGRGLAADERMSPSWSLGPAPAPTIAVIAAGSADLARAITVEADRRGKPVQVLLSELVALGWTCYLADAQEEQAA